MSQNTAQQIFKIEKILDNKPRELTPFDMLIKTYQEQYGSYLQKHKNNFTNYKLMHDSISRGLATILNINKDPEQMILDDEELDQMMNELKELTSQTNTSLQNDSNLSQDDQDLSLQEGSQSQEEIMSQELCDFQNLEGFEIKRLNKQFEHLNFETREIILPPGVHIENIQKRKIVLLKQESSQQNGLIEQHLTIEEQANLDAINFKNSKIQGLLYSSDKQTEDTQDSESTQILLKNEMKQEKSIIDDDFFVSLKEYAYIKGNVPCKRKRNDLHKERRLQFKARKEIPLEINENTVKLLDLDFIYEYLQDLYLEEYQIYVNTHSNSNLFELLRKKKEGKFKELLFSIKMLIEDPQSYEKNIDYNYKQKIVLQSIANLKIMALQRIKLLKLKDQQDQQSNQEQENSKTLLEDKRYQPNLKASTGNDIKFLTPYFLERFDFKEFNKEKLHWKIKLNASLGGFMAYMHIDESRQFNFRLVKFYCQNRYRQAQEKSIDNNQQKVKSEHRQYYHEPPCYFKLIFKCFVNLEENQYTPYELVNFNPYHNHYFEK